MATVAIVEDDPSILDMIVDVLESEGFAIITSPGDDRDAMMKIEAVHPDVALIDYQLPGMTGVEIAQAIRARPELADIRIVGMTAAHRAHRVCTEMHADACLPKPFDIEDLLAVLG